MTNYPTSEEIYNRETKENLLKEVLKGTRWLLLKNPENLDTQKKEKERLEEALKINEPLSCAYYLKEDLRQIWLQPNKETAERVFTDWVKRSQFIFCLPSWGGIYYSPVNCGSMVGLPE